MKKKIVITGCTQGLGKALVNELLSQGHEVYGSGLTNSLVQTLRKEHPDNSSFHLVDVTDFKEVKAWSQQVILDQGAPDILINNAGVVNKSAPLWEITEEEFRKVINTNVVGVSNVVRAFLPSMLKNGHGIIVNISSTLGRKSIPNFAPYCASKFAVEGLSKSLGMELPKTFCVIPLDPGIIRTEMLLKSFSNEKEIEMYPNPKEWAPRAAELILNLKPSQNGQSLEIPVLLPKLSSTERLKSLLRKIKKRAKTFLA